MQVLSADFQLASGMDILAESLHQTGIAFLYNYPMTRSLLDEVYEEWQNFFNSNEKHQYLDQTQDVQTYFTRKESNQVLSNSSDSLESFVLLNHGTIPALLSNQSKIFMIETLKLADHIFQALDKYIPNEFKKNWDQPLNAVCGPELTLSVLQANYTISSKQKNKRLNTSSYEHINFLTIQPAVTALGLEVQDANKRWHKLECDPDALIIHTGTMLQLYSNGFYKSATYKQGAINSIMQQFSKLSLLLQVYPKEDLKLSDRYTSGVYFAEKMKDRDKSASSSPQKLN